MARDLKGFFCFKMQQHSSQKGLSNEVLHFIYTKLGGKLGKREITSLTFIIIFYKNQNLSIVV